MLLLSLPHFGYQMLRIQNLKKDNIRLRCFLKAFVKYEANTSLIRHMVRKFMLPISRFVPKLPESISTGRKAVFNFILLSFAISSQITTKAFIAFFLRNDKVVFVIPVLHYDKQQSRGEAVVQRCSVKKLFLKILQNSQENTCLRVSF